MNKSELVGEIAKKSNLTKKNSEIALNALIEVVGDTLKKGEKISLVGFGSYEVRKRKARVGTNPQTREEIKIPAKKVAVFKPGKTLKELVNSKPVKETAKKEKKTKKN
jgi:DNA-binding protein HU-beta